MMLICFITAWLYTQFLQQRVWNLLILTAVVSVLLGTQDFLFYYFIWGYEHISLVFLNGAVAVRHQSFVDEVEDAIKR